MEIDEKLFVELTSIEIQNIEGGSHLSDFATGLTHGIILSCLGLSLLL
jgi:hypothetical protein